MRCNSTVLMTLVQQTADPGSETDSIARHLEHCEQCRAELSRLGGDERFWTDACQWLSIASADVNELEGYRLHQPAIDLSFLEPPTHPEMLGRIGRYEVESLLGQGGMGVVFRAYDSDLQRPVAVKVLAPQWAASATARQRFAREAQAAASVAHENVIPIYNVDATAKLPYLVMRYIPGMTLQRWVMTHWPLDVGTILRVAGQLAEGLAAAHRRGLVHRDIKPGNVLVGENIDRVWITDFGLARAADSLTLTRTGVIAGTPHYMSPEQARGGAIDHRSDLFSLGCVLYFLCVGRPPFDADNTLAVLHKIVSENAKPLTHCREDLPPTFVRLVHQLLQRSIDRRPQDCQEVIDRLAHAQAEHLKGRRSRRLSPRGQRLFAGSVAFVGLVVASLWGVQRLIYGGTQPRIDDQATPLANAPMALAMTSPAKATTNHSTFAIVASQITASLDDPKFQRQFEDLERQVTGALRPPKVLGGDSLITGQQSWNQKLADVGQVLHGLQHTTRLPDFVFDELEPTWRREVSDLEDAIRQADQSVETSFGPLLPNPRY
jgi:serine/threonine protein kinase